MNLQLIAYGIAKDILKGSQMTFSIDGQPTIGDIKAKLIADHPAFADLQSLKLAVNQDYQSDDFKVSENDEIVIIPPVSGG